MTLINNKAFKEVMHVILNTFR